MNHIRWNGVKTSDTVIIFFLDCVGCVHTARETMKKINLEKYVKQAKKKNTEIAFYDYRCHSAERLFGMITVTEN